MDNFMVGLIEKNLLTREGLKGVLRNSKYKVIAETSHLIDYNDMVGECECQLIISSSDKSPSEISSTVSLLKSKNQDARIIVLGESMEPESIRVCFSLGADGFLLKDISARALIASLDLVMCGEKVFPTSMATIISSGWQRWLDTAIEESTANTEFSKRNLEVIQYLAEGCSNKLIARNLNITESTVKVHLKAILRKLELTNRTQVAIWALNHGIKPMPETPPSGVAIN